MLHIDATAEREGFEPPVRQAHSGFQDRHIRPLCHLSSAPRGGPDPIIAGAPRRPAAASAPGEPGEGLASVPEEGFASPLGEGGEDFSPGRRSLAGASAGR